MRINHLIPAKQAKKTIKLISDLNPNSGTYGNEADYNWQNSLWGSNYERLLQIKHDYDPENLFNCHHCVGSK